MASDEGQAKVNKFKQLYIILTCDFIPHDQATSQRALVGGRHALPFSK